MSDQPASTSTCSLGPVVIGGVADSRSYERIIVSGNHLDTIKLKAIIIILYYI